MTEKIKTICIKNIRGLSDYSKDLNIIPNHPSILVAPNGSGKSSFAIAFKSVMHSRKLNVPKNEYYQNDETKRPYLSIEMDNGNKYESTDSKNEILQNFGVFVINNQIVVNTIKRNMNGIPTSFSRMSIPPIVLVKNIPTKPILENDFLAVNHISAHERVFPSIKSILNEYSYIARFNVIDLNKSINRQLLKIDNFIVRVNSYDGETDKAIKQQILDNDLDELKLIPILNSRIEELANISKNSRDEVSLYLKAIQLVLLYVNHKDQFTKLIEYAQYVMQYKYYDDLFSFFNSTWKNIKPREHEGKLIVEIPDITKISNGERDILVFISLLEESKFELKKSHNILIIDEVFDYLDDANFVAAQYYISKYIQSMHSQNKQIYPIILSHIHPGYFRSNVFNNLKIYYLVDIPSMHPHGNMVKLLNHRKADSKEHMGTISRYMFHFYNDYSHDISSILPNELCEWGSDVQKYKVECHTQTLLYLQNECYDPSMVCIDLREMIESYLYQKLKVEDKADFIITNTTRRKIKYSQEHGVFVPEIFSMLGLVYNESMHKENDQLQSLYNLLGYRLQNKTIQFMISRVVKLTNPE